MHTQDKHAQAEPEQMQDLISTSPDTGVKHDDPFLHNVSTTSIEDQAINSWIAQGTQADHMEVLDPQLFSGTLGQYGPQIAQGPEDMFTTMNPYHEGDKTRPVLMSPNSTTSLFPFTNGPICCDSWMNLSPTTSKALLSMNEHPPAPGSLEGQATLTDVTETGTPSSTKDIPSLVTPTERGKTVLTLENLNPETRSEVLDLLFRRKVITTIEIT